MTAISNLGRTLTLTTGLLSQQSTLALLSQEISSGQKYSNLTSYSPTDAHNILDFQNAITQRQSYISSMQSVQTRLSVYDSSMTDIEGVAAQANALATQNQAYNATSVADIKQQAINYLKQVTDDLNQQIGGRYIYAGTRYTTKPVTDLTTLTNAPSATTTTSPALPSYDTDFNNATSFTVNSGTGPTGNFKVGSDSFPIGQITNLSGNTANVTVTTSSGPQIVIVTGLTVGNSPSITAANLATTINQVAAAVPSSEGIASLTATASSGTVTMDFNGAAPQAVTPDSGGATGEITWAGNTTPDGTIAQTPNSSAAAYTQDSALIDSNFSVTYGVSSNDPSFQKLVNGMRFIVAGCTAGQGGDSATYQADMQQAASLISSGLSGIQTIHANVANNQNILTQQTTLQNSDITALQNQLTSIQHVDLTQVGTELSLLQTQLQASYSSTASLQQLSLTKYL